MNKLFFVTVLMGCLYGLPTTGVAQNCNLTRVVLYPTTVWSDPNWGWDPWGARGMGYPIDPRFTENPNYPSYPNNDSYEIAGFNFVSNAACYVPLYHNKLFYYDPVSNVGPSFNFPLYQREEISQGGGSRWSRLGIVYAMDNLSNFACNENTLSISPGPGNAGSHTVYLILHGHENANTFSDEAYGQYSQFNVTIEAAPEWQNLASLNSLCSGDQRTIDLTSYITNPNGVYIFVDGVRTSVLNVATLSPGNHNLYLYKYYDNGSWSATDVITVAPPPPTYGSLSTVDACPGGGGGSISVTGISGIANYSYILVPFAGAGDCDPTKHGSCSDFTDEGYFTADTLTISNLQQGTYTLLLANNGGNGACYTSIPITIGASAAVSHVDSTHTDISCAGGSDGSITLHTSGGRPGTVVYHLSRQGGPELLSQPTGIFTGLTSGTYVINVTDGCNMSTTAPDLRETFTLVQPTQVTGTFTSTDPTCTNPGNGSMTTTVSQGSGTYNYYLYQNGVAAASQLGTTNTSWQVDNLAAGLYNLQVLDAARPSCAGYTATVTLAAPPALSLVLTQKTDLTCYGISTGSITLQGGGGTGAYNYTITNTNTGGSFTNTTGIFTALAAGNYTAVLSSAVSGCLDQYTYPQPVVISQPADISITMNPVDVRCYGEGNGSITAGLSGGTGPLAPAWQLLVNGNWTATGGSAVSLNNLVPGSYRLSVTDANSCNKVSPAVTIVQPDTLVIPSVGMTDIVCYGGSGTITPIATGGNGGNVFAVSAGGGAYTAFVPGAAFPVGSYQVMVTDQKGCAAGYAGTQVITAPPSPLVFSDQLSDYHGFNISCYGATNGIVTTAASGGNGSSYSGYTYSVDGGGWLSSPVLNGLAAGSHIIRVQDGRGCVVQQAETLTQPASEMTETLLNKKDNDCVDGLAGWLSVSVAGGTAPYQFSKDGTNYQDNGDFTGLASGAYTITAIDINGCRLGADYTVVSLYPALVISHTVDAVQCNGGSDGRIALDVSGGYGAYNYQWTRTDAPVLMTNGATVNGLKAGTYVARVTDEKGCTKMDTALVSQPTAMAAQLVVRPLCSDATGGRVRIAAGGGTPPYRYSVDGGANYQADSSFTNLPAGGYTVGVIDSHGCTWDQAITITTQPLIPLVNFLVSTQQNVLDTLQVEDISSPKPDSVQWSFDTATLLLGYSPEGPLIRYAKPGTYPASMRAYYAGCDFSTSQNILIQPYDTNSTSPMVLAGLSIDTATLAPNPNSGTFNLYVKLYKAQRLVLTVTSLSGQSVFRKQWDGQQVISEQINLPSNIVSGGYIAELVTETDVRDYNIIVTK